MSLTNFEDEFLRVRHRPDQYAPEIEHRKIERVQVGTWLFGLLPEYEYRYTDWEKNNATCGIEGKLWEPKKPWYKFWSQKK